MPFAPKSDADRGVQRQIRISPALVARLESEAARIAPDKPPGWSTVLRLLAEAELKRRERRAAR